MKQLQTIKQSRGCTKEEAREKKERKRGRDRWEGRVRRGRMTKKRKSWQ